MSRKAGVIGSMPGELNGSMDEINLIEFKFPERLCLDVIHLIPFAFRYSEILRLKLQFVIFTALNRKFVAN